MNLSRFKEIKLFSNNNFLNSNNLSGELRKLYSNKINSFLSVSTFICSLLLNILASKSRVDVLIKEVNIIKITIINIII